MRSRSKSLILALFTVVFLLSVISNLNLNSNSIHFNPINEDTSLKSSANEITISTPENITYTEPMSGFYPATYGFENDLPDSEPSGWDVRQPDGSGFIEVDAIHAGHRNVVELRKTGGTNKAQLTKIFPDNATVGTIEFWLYKDTDSGIDPTRMVIGGDDGSVQFGIQSGDLYQGPFGGPTIASNVFTINTWHHIRVDFNLSLGWQIRLDDTWYGSGYSFPFEDTPTELYYFVIASIYSGDNPDYGVWLDALDYSWHVNYDIGDNFNEGLLLSYDTTENLVWKGYSLDGQANVTILGNHTIPVPVNGTHTIQVFGTDSIGTIYQSNLRSFTYGTTSGLQITIQSPDFDDFYGSIAPTYWVTINGEYDTVWYTLDNGVTNITASGLNEIIDQTEWDKVVDGIVNLRFYVNNSLGNLTYSDVNFTKDTVAPIITINSPINYEKFGKMSPSFDISIIEPYLDTMWYTIDSGVTNISISSFTGTIDQIEWDKLENGTVSITFYADDESTNIGFASVIIEKEITPPEITIISPNDNDLFSSTAPSFQLAIQEPDLDTTWYTLDDGVTNFIFSGLMGIIDQIEWDKFGNGTISIKFYANDTFGYVNFSQVTVQKDIEGPIIIINSPEPWVGFSSEAPTFNISVIDVRLDSMWYSLDNGSTVIPLFSTTGTIDQTEWDKLSEGSVYIRFYANDTIGNTAYAEVVVSIDTISPVITINDPGYHELFGLSSPMFNLSINEVNLEEMWYTLDNGITNMSISSLVELIDQIEWSKVGNGTVTIQFFANDSAGNIGSTQIEIIKDIVTPSITINTPSESDVFGLDAPTYSISIVEPHLDMLRYSLDGWSTYFNIISTTGSINQTEWDKFGSGEITLRFFAIDLVGNNISVQVTIYKDISAPVITINSPVPDEIFSSIAPNFDITVFDISLDSMWYTIDNGTTIIPLFGSTGVIDQTEWDKLGDGSVYLRFYANDTRGYTDYSEVVIVKDFFFGIEPLELITPSAYSNLYSNSVVFSWYSIEAVFGSVNFTLQVSNATDFSYINYQMENIAEMLVITNFSVSLPIGQGQYYWRVRYTYGNHNGSWSDYFSFTLYINNYAPNLVLDEFTPTTGTRYTIFRFTVTYTDSDNNPPSYIRIILNGTSYSLEKVNPLDNDFTDGCLYQFLVCLNPAEYAYTFSFECSDGGFYGLTSTFFGPIVEAEDPPDDEPGLDNLNSTNAMIMGISVVTGLGIVIPMVVLTEIKIKKHKIKPKQHSKIKK
jgi:hypothetical protein